jgi:hypothetical protein
MVVPVGASCDRVDARDGSAGAETEGGIEGLGSGNVWDSGGFDGVDEEEDDNLIDAADREGPSFAATIADRSASDRFPSLTKRLNSYLSKSIKEKSWDKLGSVRKKYDVPRMNFSNSLSRSTSNIFVGGGLRTSSGLCVWLELTFPICRMFCKRTSSYYHRLQVSMLGTPRLAPSSRRPLSSFS